MLFADTSFFVAFLNSRDVAHAASASYMTEHAGKIATTTWVLLELGNFLSVGRQRRFFKPLVSELRRDSRFTILPISDEQMARCVDEYNRAIDKRWSLTDVASFMVMRSHRMRDALTCDRHFRQAGFRILL